MKFAEQVDFLSWLTKVLKDPKRTMEMPERKALAERLSFIVKDMQQDVKAIEWLMDRASEQ